MKNLSFRIFGYYIYTSSFQTLFLGSLFVGISKAGIEVILFFFPKKEIKRKKFFNLKIPDG